MKEFRKVITNIYHEKGVRSLLLFAEKFGQMEEVEFNNTTKTAVKVKGIGKTIVEKTERKYINGAEAKEMCHTYVKNQIEKGLHKEGSYTDEKVRQKFQELLTSLGF